jgi:hypothetical protein
MLGSVFRCRSFGVFVGNGVLTKIIIKHNKNDYFNKIEK